MFARKDRPVPTDLSELPCKTQPFETVAKMLVQRCQPHLVQNVHSGNTEKTEWPTYLRAVIKKKKPWQNIVSTVSYWLRQSASQR